MEGLSRFHVASNIKMIERSRCEPAALQAYGALWVWAGSSASAGCSFPFGRAIPAQRCMAAVSYIQWIKIYRSSPILDSTPSDGGRCPLLLALGAGDIIPSNRRRMKQSTRVDWDAYHMHVTTGCIDRVCRVFGWYRNFRGCGMSMRMCNVYDKLGRISGVSR